MLNRQRACYETHGGAEGPVRTRTPETVQTSKDSKGHVGVLGVVRGRRKVGTSREGVSVDVDGEREGGSGATSGSDVNLLSFHPDTSPLKTKVRSLGLQGFSPLVVSGPADQPYPSSLRVLLLPSTCVQRSFPGQEAHRVSRDDTLTGRPPNLPELLHRLR